MFKSLKAKILSRMLALVVVGIGIVGVVSSVLNYTSTVSTMEEMLGELAVQSGVRISNRLGKSMAIVREMGLHITLSNPDSTEEDKFNLLRKRAETYSLTDYGFITADGVNHSEKHGNGVNYSSAALFTVPMSGEIYIQGPAPVDDVWMIYF